MMRSSGDVGWFAHVRLTHWAIGLSVLFVRRMLIRKISSRRYLERYLSQQKSFTEHIYIYTCIYICMYVCVCQPLPLHDMLRTATTGPGNATRHVQRMCFWCVLDMTLLGKKWFMLFTIFRSLCSSFIKSYVVSMAVYRYMYVHIYIYISHVHIKRFQTHVMWRLLCSSHCSSIYIYIYIYRHKSIQVIFKSVIDEYKPVYSIQITISHYKPI